MHVGIPALGWEKDVPFPEFVSMQYVRNPADYAESGVRIMFQTQTGEVGRIVLPDKEADQLSRMLRDTLINNRRTVT